MPIFMELLIDFIVGLDVQGKRKKQRKPLSTTEPTEQQREKEKHHHDDDDDDICLLLLNCIYFCVFMEISLPLIIETQ